MAERTHLICARCGGDTAVSNRFDSDGTLRHDERMTRDGRAVAASFIRFRCSHCKADYPLPVMMTAPSELGGN